MDSYERTYHLLCPGPVNVHAEIASALTSYEFCHREEEFSALYHALQKNILEFADLDAADFAAVVITGSGTAANESVLSSAVPYGSKVLIVSNGEFGERLARIASHHHETAEHMQQPWGELLDIDAIEARLSQGDVRLVCMVHHETSTGMLNPVEAVGALAQKYGAFLFLDAVSSFTADPLDLAAAGVTFMSSSAGKAIGCYPGLSVVVGRRDAFEAMTNHRRATHYLDLWRHYDFAQRVNQTPNTPAVPLFLALNRAFELALEEGVQTRFERFGELTQYVRTHIDNLGLAMLLDPAHCSQSLTSVLLPEWMDFEILRTELRERGFVVYEGKGPLKGRIFQVSTLGDMKAHVIDAFFEALGQVLEANQPAWHLPRRNARLRGAERADRLRDPPDQPWSL